MDTTLIRLALPDRPGGLALATRCLAACGVDILAVEVVGHRDGAAIDDLLVRGGDLGRALEALADEVTLLGSRHGRALPDPGIAMAVAFAGIVSAPDAASARDAMISSLLAMVGADAGALLLGTESGGLAPLAVSPGPLPAIAGDEPSLARRVLRSGLPVIATADGAWAPQAWRERLAARHIACAPVAIGIPAVLLLARSDEFPFVDAEVDRARALVEAASPGLLGAGLQGTARPPA
jgi:hypothetical protein